MSGGAANETCDDGHLNPPCLATGATYMVGNDLGGNLGCWSMAVSGEEEVRE
jgi:hypothetical protein